VLVEVLALGVGVGSWMGRVNVGGMGDQGVVAGFGSDREEVAPVAAVAERSVAVEGPALHFYSIDLGVILSDSGVAERVGCLSGPHYGQKTHSNAASGYRGLAVVNWL
jgi:hypothetical protein